MLFKIICIPEVLIMTKKELKIFRVILPLMVHSKVHSQAIQDISLFSLFYFPSSQILTKMKKKSHKFNQVADEKYQQKNDTEE